METTSRCFWGGPLLHATCTKVQDLQERARSIQRKQGTCLSIRLTLRLFHKSIEILYVEAMSRELTEIAS